VKIKKLCTYENLQLQNEDGTRPKGIWARLSKTFTSDNFNIELLPGIGAKITGKNPEDGMSTFVVPFANIPYIVAENDSGEGLDTNEARNIVRRRRAKKATNKPEVERLLAVAPGSDSL
jgi:hypothetical protein